MNKTILTMEDKCYVHVWDRVMKLDLRNKISSRGTDNTYIFRHCDLDGAGSAGSIINQLDADNSICERIRKIDYDYDFTKSDVLTKIRKGERITFWIVDFSCSEDHIRQLKKLKDSSIDIEIVWIDHHGSSLKLEDDVLNYAYDNMNAILYNGRSGAYLTYITAALVYGFFTFPSNMCIPEIIDYISDYDCWQKKLFGTDEFFYGISALSIEPETYVGAEFWRSCIYKGIVDECIKRGIIIKKSVDAENKRICEADAFEFKLALPDGVYSTKKCIGINRNCNSFVFGNLSNEYDVMCVFHFNGRYWEYSFYSDNGGDTDCSKIAKIFGGGGHAGASGCQITNNIFIEGDGVTLLNASSDFEPYKGK